MARQQDLFNLFMQFLRFMDEKSYTYGKLGVVQDNKKLVKVPGKPYYNFVRVMRASGISPGICINMRTSAKFDLYVKMKENEEGVLQVIDAISEEAIASVGDGGPNLSIGPHTHRRGAGNYDRVEGIRFEPGGGEINTELGAMYISIWPLHHAKNYFPGKDLDLSPYKPTNLNEKRWVKIGIDKDLNAIEVVEGPLVSLAAQLSEKSLWNLAFIGTDVLPSTGIVLRGDQNVLTESTKIVDCRYWASGNTSSAVGGGASLVLSPMKTAKIIGGTATIGAFDGSNTSELFTGFTEDFDTFAAVNIATNDDRINIAYGEGGVYLIGYSVDMAKAATSFPFTIKIELFLDNAGTPFYTKDFYTDWSVSSQDDFVIDGSILHEIPDEIIAEVEIDHYIRMHVNKFNGESVALNFVGLLWVVKQEITIKEVV